MNFEHPICESWKRTKNFEHSWSTTLSMDQHRKLFPGQWIRTVVLRNHIQSHKLILSYPEWKLPFPSSITSMNSRAFLEHTHLLPCIFSFHDAVYWFSLSFYWFVFSFLTSKLTQCYLAPTPTFTVLWFFFHNLFF